MKYCVKCGNELMDEAVLCPKCGCLTGYNGNKVSYSSKNNGLKTAAKVFMIISTVFMGFYLIPLAWCIPMTVSYFNKIKNGEQVSTGFKVCCLIFVSLFAGILMLSDKD